MSRLRLPATLPCPCLRFIIEIMVLSVSCNLPLLLPSLHGCVIGSHPHSLLYLYLPIKHPPPALHLNLLYVPCLISSTPHAEHVIYLFSTAVLMSLSLSECELFVVRTSKCCEGVYGLKPAGSAPLKGAQHIPIE